MNHDDRLANLVDARGPIAMCCCAVLGLVLLPLLTRSFIDHPPLYDELLHLLAARGVLETGQPVIDSGLYPRAELFTRIVAIALDAFGDDPVAARLPALVAGAALTGLIGAWVCRHAGFLAGAAATTILVIAPSSLSLAAFARFYTLHALATAVMLIAVYEALVPDRARGARAVLLVVAAIATILALRLQETTVISVGAGILAVGALWAVDRRELVIAQVLKRPLAIGAGTVVFLMIGLLAIWQLGLVERLGTAPLWAAGRADRISYYNTVLIRDFPLLWPLLPVATLAAFYRNWRLALFCSVVIAAALVVHSIAAQKAVRYFYHVLPLVCALWGIGFREAVVLGAGALRRVLPRRIELTWVVSFVVISLVLANSTEGQRAARLLLARGTVDNWITNAAEADWSLALPALQPLIDRAGSVVASSSVKGLYALGRYDYELNASVVHETETGQEFGRDPRTGRRAIGTAESITQVLGEQGPVLVVIEDEKLDDDGGAPTPAMNVIRERCVPIDVPAAARLQAWDCPSQG